MSLMLSEYWILIGADEARVLQCSLLSSVCGPLLATNVQPKLAVC